MARRVFNPEEITTLSVSKEYKAFSRLVSDMSKYQNIQDRNVARFIVQLYYDIQNMRITLGHRENKLIGNATRSALVEYLYIMMQEIEEQIQRWLDEYSDSTNEGRWIKSIHGIGPVIASGILAYIDFDKPSVGHIWSYAGLVAGVKKVKGKKISYSPRLKQIMYHAGECLVRTSGSEKSYYGDIYRKRKEFEVANNEAGLNREYALELLKTQNFRVSAVKDDGTEKSQTEIAKEVNSAKKCYSEGKLTKAHVHRRAVRWLEKMFLSHVYEGVRHIRGLPVPRPYVIEHMGHIDYVPPPDFSAYKYKP